MEGAHCGATFFLSPRAFFFKRRMAFFFSIRSSSLLETNQRLRRTSDKTLLFITAFLKRRSSCSGVSLSRATTFGRVLTSFLVKIQQSSILTAFSDFCQTNSHHFFPRLRKIHDSVVGCVSGYVIILWEVFCLISALVVPCLI